MIHTLEDCLAFLETHDIRPITVRHDAAHTMEELVRVTQDQHLPGTHCKNLFVKDDRKRQWLVVALGDTKVDMKRLSKHLAGNTSMRFGTAEMLSTLGMYAGACTPFGLANDTDCRVSLVLDARIQSCDMVTFHPMDNTASCAITVADLLKFAEITHHSPTWVDFESLNSVSAS
jgi:Ala-tRNA(Pro) deacylase